MIRSIRLVNWRSHQDSRLEFSKGTNLLVGIMGAGKSSILEGISFALYGTFPALERRKLKLENIVRLNEPQAKAVLVFDWDGSSYRIERAIERDKKGASSSAELYKDNAMLEHGPSAVTKHIEAITGVDYDLFTRAIYSEQNNIDYFLNLDPRRRKEEIDALLGLDRFETARASVISVIHRLKSRRQGLEGQFSRERLSSLEGDEKIRNSKLETTKTELAKAAAAYDKHRQDVQRLQKEFEGLRQKKEQAESLAKEDIRLTAQHSSLAKELEGKTVDEAALETLNAELKALDIKRTGLRQKLKRIEETIASLSKESGMLDAKAKSIAEAKSRLESAREERIRLLAGKTSDQLESLQKEAEKSILSLESERKSLEREIAERTESLRKLKPGLSECPLCLSKLTEDGLAHVKKEQVAHITEAKARSEELPALLAEQKKRAESSQSAIRKLSLLSERIQALEKESKEVPALAERKMAVEGELSARQKERIACQSDQERLSENMESTRAKATELKSLLIKKSEAAKLQERLQQIKQSLAQLSFDEKSYESSRSATEQARLESERASAAKSALEKELQLTTEMLLQLRKELGALRSMEKEISALASLDEQLSLYKNALLETQTSLRLTLADAINTAMNEIWGMFYPYKNYAALKLGVTEKDYLFEVDDGSGWHPLETIASGGERACAALALRISLAMVLTPKLGWLILDEPTHNLDTEAVELLSSALQTRVPEVVKQIFVITHEERFIGSDFASSYRLKRDKESNGQTIVEAD
ncbi:MAG: SMC family ATPase [Candidatus Micrarchaeota archaeon]